MFDLCVDITSDLTERVSQAITPVIDRFQSMTSHGVGAYWPTFTYVAGAAIGSIQSISRFGGLGAKDLALCLFDSYPFSSGGALDNLNSVRDMTYGTVGLVHLSIAGMDLINVIRGSRGVTEPLHLHPSRFRMFYEAVSSYVSQDTAVSLSSMSINAMRAIVAPLFRAYGFDESGHAAIAIVNALHTSDMVRSAYQRLSPLQTASAIAGVSAMALADFAWAWKTAASCHTPTEVAVGLAIGLVAYKPVTSAKKIYQVLKAGGSKVLPYVRQHKKAVFAVTALAICALYQGGVFLQEAHRRDFDECIQRCFREHIAMDGVRPDELDLVMPYLDCIEGCV